MSEWISGRLGEFIQLQRGYDLPEYQREQGEAPVVTSSGISGTHSVSKVMGPGVVMGRYGTLGNIYYIEDDYWPHNTTLFVKDFGGNDPRFVAYFLRTLHYKAHSDKSSVPGLNRNDLHTIKVTMPSPYEQREIARILGALDDKIELNRRMNATLEATARALFQSWFVDFDPVRAKAEGRQPQGMDAETAALFPDSFEESALGLIPKGWRWELLSKFCRISRGASPRPINDYMNGTVPWVKIADATAANGPFIFQTKEKVKQEGVSKSVFLTKGTLILSNSATTGMPVFLEIDGCIHDGWLYFSGLHTISQNYLYFVLLTISNHLTAIADGTVQKNLNTALVGSQRILAPSSEVLKRFDALTLLLLQQVKSNGYQSSTLAEMRDALLPKLMSGEVRVGG